MKLYFLAQPIIKINILYNFEIIMGFIGINRLKKASKTFLIRLRGNVLSANLANKVLLSAHGSHPLRHFHFNLFYCTLNKIRMLKYPSLLFID